MKDYDKAVERYKRAFHSYIDLVKVVFNEDKDIKITKDIYYLMNELMKKIRACQNRMGTHNKKNYMNKEVLDQINR